WLIFADSDDFFNGCFINAISRYLNSNADIVYFSATSVDNETLEPRTRHIRLEEAIRSYNESSTNSADTIKYSNWEPWSKMFKHNFIIENRIFFDEVMVGNDLGFVLTAGHLSKKILVDQSPIYCVTYRVQSLSYE